MWGPGGLRKQHKDTREHLPERQALPFSSAQSCGAAPFLRPAGSKRPYKMHHCTQQNKSIRRARRGRYQSTESAGAAGDRRSTGVLSYVYVATGGGAGARIAAQRVPAMQAPGPILPGRAGAPQNPPFAGATFGACAEQLRVSVQAVPRGDARTDGARRGRLRRAAGTVVAQGAKRKAVGACQKREQASGEDGQEIEPESSKATASKAARQKIQPKETGPGAGRSQERGGIRRACGRGTGRHNVPLLPKTGFSLPPLDRAPSRQKMVCIGCALKKSCGLWK